MNVGSVGIALSLFLGSHTYDAAARSQHKLFEQNVSDSDHLRTEQARELDQYVLSLKTSKARLDGLFHPDFTSKTRYEASIKSFRARFADSIGYPPPGPKPTDKASFSNIGEDEIGFYMRVQIPVCAGIHAEGIYIVPKGMHGKVPLVISMHGGGGSPEVALFHGGSNYHDMVRGAVKQGYAVFAPQHLFSAKEFPPDIRNRIDDRLRLVGTSLTAVEIAKITRSIDVLIKRPEIDAHRIAMVGLSYGGYYALVTPAIDTRIKVSVSSCYFGVQEYRYEADELAVPSDFRFPDRFSLFQDPVIAALICPRALMIQAGKGDDGPHRDMGIRLSPEVEAIYKRVGIPEAFKFVLFDGGHEFHDKSAWEFIKRNL